MYVLMAIKTYVFLQQTAFTFMKVYVPNLHIIEMRCLTRAIVPSLSAGKLAPS